VEWLPLKEVRVWPYVLPFPLDIEKRKMIWSILQSKVGLSILARMQLEERTYQQELIHGTRYSNKSIIEHLKKMVLAGVLDQGMEQVLTEKKRIWVKWYAPTQLGRWLILFLKNPDEVSLNLTKKTVEELFQLYSSSIVEVCEKYGLSPEFFHQILDEHAKKKTRIVV